MDDKKVRFSKKNDTCLIENRVDSKRNPSFQPTKKHLHTRNTNNTCLIDDEVKGHPVFLKHSTTNTNTNKNTTSIIDTSKIESQKMAKDLLKQLKTDPTEIINPITHRKVTRFGTNYWKLLESMFGLDSDIFKQEKEIYKKKYK
jgi:hypothetical protein